MNQLKEVVLEIVKSMEEIVEKYDSVEISVIQGWVSNLKIACKMTPDEVVPPPKPQQNFVTHGDVYAASLAEARKNKKKNELSSKVQEIFEPRMAELVGLDKDENIDATFMEIHPQMPLGAKTERDGQVFILAEGNKLVYSQTETRKLANQRKEHEERKVILTS